jgi:hypothetical protein
MVIYNSGFNLPATRYNDIQCLVITVKYCVIAILDGRRVISVRLRGICLLLPQGNRYREVRPPGARARHDRILTLPLFLRALCTVHKLAGNCYCWDASSPGAAEAAAEAAVAETACLLLLLKCWERLLPFMLLLGACPKVTTQ